MKELYKKYRPKSFEDVIGQDAVVKQLEGLFKSDNFPHAVLLNGEKGLGKTSISRILRRKLKCSKFDYNEVNCANHRGIDFIRSIERNAGLSPMQGNTKVWTLDECHMLTSEASNAFLKILEDTPKHVYFILCTTDPQKVIATIRSRCTSFALEPFDSSSLRKLIRKVCKLEKAKISEEVEDKIAANADNSARNALVLLDKVLGLEDEESQLEAISKSTVEVAAIQIARAIFDPRTKWPDMAKILKSTELEEPEQIRWMVLGYAKTILLSGGKMSGRAFDVISVFRDNWFDCKASGLAACCFEVITGK